MELINELRMLAEDLYVNGYNRYSAAMSKAADELGSLERYRTAYNEWVDKTEWVQADTTLHVKYLGMHRADAIKDLISELFDRLEAAESECLEESRLNGMGSEREAALMAKLEAALMAKLEAAENDAAHQKALADSALRVAEGWEEQCNALRAEVIHIKEVEFPRKAQAVADGWRGKCERLEAKITEMEQQAPVAWMSARNGFICKENKNPDYNVPLYPLPGAQGEEK